MKITSGGGLSTHIEREMNSIYFSYQYTRLTNDKSVLIGKVVFRNLQIEGSRSLPCSSSYTSSAIQPNGDKEGRSTNIIMGSVTRTEPSAKVARLAYPVNSLSGREGAHTDRDTSEMSANTKHYKPFGFLDSI